MSLFKHFRQISFGAFVLHNLICSIINIYRKSLHFKEILTFFSKKAFSYCLIVMKRCDTYYRFGMLKMQCIFVYNFNRFPHKKELLSEWIAAVGKNNWYPSKTSVLCGKHFLEDDFVLGSYPDSSLKKRFLKKGAIPSVFSIPATPSSTEKKANTT